VARAWSFSEAFAAWLQLLPFPLASIDRLRPFAIALSDSGVRVGFFCRLAPQASWPRARPPLILAIRCCFFEVGFQAGLWLKLASRRSIMSGPLPKAVSTNQRQRQEFGLFFRFWRPILASP